MLHCAIRENGVFRGYIGLDECESNRVWTKEQVNTLVFVSQVVASFLLKKRVADKAHRTVDNLNSILGTQHNWMYVIEPGTYRVRYLNHKTKSALPDLKPGELCYKAIMGVDTPCEGCPVAKLRDGYGKSRLKSKALGITVVSEATEITWDGEPSWLISCREPDQEG